MATKSKLEKAVEGRVGNMNEAQKELVLSQLSVYKRNRTRMADITVRLKAMDSVSLTRDEIAERSALSYEFNQIATANSRISAELFSQLGDECR